MHLPEQGTLTRGLLAYLAGFVVLSAGMAVTQPLGVAASYRILDSPPTDPRLGWAVFRGAVTLQHLINAIPFFLAGLCIGWLIGRRALLHGLAFGLGCGAFGLLIVAVMGYAYGDTPPRDREGMGWAFAGFVALSVLVGIVASGLGGALAGLLRKSRARQPV